MHAMKLFQALLLLTLSVLPGTAMAQGSAASTSDAERLHKLLADDWQYFMTAYPEFATSAGTLLRRALGQLTLVDLPAAVALQDLLQNSG